MAADFDPDGSRLPIKLDATSNGEFMPRPLGPAATRAVRLAHRRVDALSRRLGQSRRAFLTSACGVAATLLAFNQAFAAARRDGGYHALPEEAAVDPQLAQEAVDGGEFIFDAQTHHVDASGGWSNHWNEVLSFYPQSRCADPERPECLSAEALIREVFHDSDTSVATLSMVPSAPDENPLTTAEAARTREMVAALQDGGRLFIQSLVQPRLPGAFERMERDAAEYGVSGWKMYTQWGPDGVGFFMDDEAHGIPLIEKGLALGVGRFVMHKGLPLTGGYPYEYSTCRDVGPAARMFPQATFIVYHSGFVPGEAEGPYDPDRTDGVDRLIASCRENGIGPDGNVYAELGSTWRYVMRDPEQAAHLLGKLLVHLGPDRILWGTDSVWYGSPQDQIQAFRTFQISERLRERYGYPEITPAIRARIFGLNAAELHGIDPAAHRRRTRGDDVETERETRRERPNPSFMTYGPRNRREFLALQRITGPLG